MFIIPATNLQTLGLFRLAGEYGSEVLHSALCLPPGTFCCDLGGCCSPGRPWVSGCKCRGSDAAGATDSLQSGPHSPFLLAKLVNTTPITVVCGTHNSNVHEIYTGQNWGHASTMFHASVDQRVGRVGPPWGSPRVPKGR